MKSQTPIDRESRFTEWEIVGCATAGRKRFATLAARGMKAWGLAADNGTATEEWLRRVVRVKTYPGGCKIEAIGLESAQYCREAGAGLRFEAEFYVTTAQRLRLQLEREAAAADDALAAARNPSEASVRSKNRDDAVSELSAASKNQDDAERIGAEKIALAGRLESLRPEFERWATATGDSAATRERSDNPPAALPPPRMPEDIRNSDPALWGALASDVNSLIEKRNGYPPILGSYRAASGTSGRPEGNFTALELIEQKTAHALGWDRSGSATAFCVWHLGQHLWGTTAAAAGEFVGGSEGGTIADVLKSCEKFFQRIQMLMTEREWAGGSGIKAKNMLAQGSEHISAASSRGEGGERSTAGGVPSWSARLLEARKAVDKGLSRPNAARRMKGHEGAVTAEAIKKHEQGRAFPKPATRKLYAKMYDVEVEKLFPQ